MATISSNLFSIRIAPAPALLASFKLHSAVGGAALPFTLGYAFKRGDVPTGHQVAGSEQALQVVAKNAWPDGSLKFAVISGRATLESGIAKTITLGVGSASSATVLTLADLIATSVTAQVSASGIGVATWAGADWNAPLRQWVSGPQMSSWIYRKPVASDPHLVAWLELRLYAGGAVEVLPWIENGYLNVAAPMNKSAQYGFTLGGVERFSASIDLPNHCRTVLISGTHTSYWLSKAPDVTPEHDKAYFQASKLVPAYRAVVPDSAPVWTRLAQSYTPLQQGNYPNAMGQAGYQPAIGLIPEWDVLYLTGSKAGALAGVIFNAFSAGRYGIHYRDETTLRPLRFSSYPNLVVHGGASTGIANSGASSKSTYTPPASGTVPAIWDTPHHPSLGFTAYLLTGRFYFMEEVQFSATLNFLKNTDTTRKFSLGIFQSNSGANTTRGAGWALRTLAQAACVTPDDDVPLRNEFLASMAANVDYYHAIYVAQPNNPFGFVAPYSNYSMGSGKYSEAGWMQDFFTAAVGYTLDLQLALPAASNTRLREFFAWKARSIIGRLGGTASADYLYRDAGLYTVAVAAADTANFIDGSGPWYANWGEMYAATTGQTNSGENGPLRNGNFPDPTSYWGNLQPAIAYAVEHNVPGAVAAYARMVGASNWSTFESRMNSAPVWSVMPRAR